jgi:pteridine reductase
MKGPEMNGRYATLEGKTALVTGAGVRLGRATALALADEGVSLIVHCNASRDEADRTAEEARARGVKVSVLEADLSDSGEAEVLFDRAVAEAGAIDFLVNNASIFPGGTLLEFTSDDLAANVGINAFAPLVLARNMARRGSGGAVVNFLDTRITHYDRNHAAYHLSKRMLFSLTRMMAFEFAPGLRVNAVAPGLILPPPGAEEGYLEKLARRIPMGRPGSVGDVTGAVLYLLDAPYVTGQVLFVDGGQFLDGSVYG